MSIAEAFKGAAFEIRDTPGGLGARLGTTARLAATIGRELGGLPALLPWATRARLDRARAPAPGRGGGDASVAPDQGHAVRAGRPPGGGRVGATRLGECERRRRRARRARRRLPPPPRRTPRPRRRLGIQRRLDARAPAASALAAASGAAVAVPNYTLWPDGGSDSGKGGAPNPAAWTRARPTSRPRSGGPGPAGWGPPSRRRPRGRAGPLGGSAAHPTPSTPPPPRHARRPLGGRPPGRPGRAGLVGGGGALPPLPPRPPR